MCGRAPIGSAVRSATMIDLFRRRGRWFTTSNIWGARSRVRHTRSTGRRRSFAASFTPRSPGSAPGMCATLSAARFSRHLALNEPQVLRRAQSDNHMYQLLFLIHGMGAGARPANDPKWWTSVLAGIRKSAKTYSHDGDLVLSSPAAGQVLVVPLTYHGFFDDIRAQWA